MGLGDGQGFTVKSVVKPFLYGAVGFVIPRNLNIIKRRLKSIKDSYNL